MTVNRKTTLPFEEYCDCFGEFDIEDFICHSRCALRIRCCIEKEENLRMEILEDLFEQETPAFRIH